MNASRVIFKEQPERHTLERHREHQATCGARGAAQSSPFRSTAREGRKRKKRKGKREKKEEGKKGKGEEKLGAQWCAQMNNFFTILRELKGFSPILVVHI